MTIYCYTVTLGDKKYGYATTLRGIKKVAQVLGLNPAQIENGCESGLPRLTKTDLVESTTPTGINDIHGQEIKPNQWIKNRAGTHGLVKWYEHFQHYMVHDTYHGECVYLTDDDWEIAEHPYLEHLKDAKARGLDFHE